MYGTIAHMKGKPGARNLFMRLESGRRPVGLIGTYVFDTGAADEFWAVVVFESQESYTANAESLEQDHEYRQLRILLVEDPEWHDGEIIFDSFFPARRAVRHGGDE